MKEMGLKITKSEIAVQCNYFTKIGLNSLLLLAIFGFRRKHQFSYNVEKWVISGRYITLSF